MKERGIRVPEDIAVTGYMNIQETIISDPPLTTINEPLYELGRNAILALENIFEGKEKKEKIRIPTELIIRKSCGCSKSEQKKESVQVLEKVTEDKAHNRQYKKDIEDQGEIIFRSYKSKKSKEIFKELVGKFEQAIADKNYEFFIALLQRIMDENIQSEEAIIWVNIVSLFEEYLIKAIELDEDHRFYQGFLKKLLTLKHEMEDKMMVYKNSEFEFYINLFRDIVGTINNAFDLIAIKDYALRILDLSELYISVFKDKQRIDLAYNMLAVNNKEMLEIRDDEKGYESKLLVPQVGNDYKERYTLMVFLLSYRKDPLGFMVLNLSDRKTVAYENMQIIISTALKSERQIQELIQAEERFSDIAHSTSDWLWESDESYNFTYSSANVKNILGYSEKELIGRRIFDLNGAENIPYEESMIKRESLIDIECLSQHKNGNSRYLLLSATPIIKEGRFNGYRGVFKDITERKLKDAKIKNLAYYDILTGLPNRTMFQDRIETALEDAKDRKEKFALVFLDIENDDIALDILQGFNRNGINIAIDDFGTGYSSLQCIQKYPIDIVKIDRLFVRDAISNPKNIAIISAVTHLAKSLKLETVAEGVETLEELQLVDSLDCNSVQGFYFAKPCESNEIETIIHKDFRFVI